MVSDLLKQKYVLNEVVTLTQLSASIEDVDNLTIGLVEAGLITPAIKNDSLTAITFDMTSFGHMVYDSLKNYKKRSALK